MKYFFLAFILMGSLNSNAQHRLQKLWATQAIIATPESVLFDSNENVLYVSLIDGSPWEADGKGGIAKLSPDGKGYDSSWIAGLNAPKGMGIYKDRLYAADITEVAVIDRKKGKVEKKIVVPDGLMLNDITISATGIIYVSDSKSGKVYKIENDVPTLYLKDLQGVNGLKSIGDDLYIGAGRSFIKVDKNKTITSIAELPEGIDGIEPVGNGDFILTSWVGLVYYVTADGKSQTLLDTREQKLNAADIGYDAAKKIVYVPTFMGNTVAAYQLE